MNKRLLAITLLILSSCTSNCRECEKQLEQCKKTKMLPVDLPKTPYSNNGTNRTTLTIEITEDDKYTFESREFSFKELTAEIDLRIQSSKGVINTIKILGEKNAHYASIFQLITFCQKKELLPIFSLQE